MPRVRKDRKNRVVPPWEKNLHQQIKTGLAIPLISSKVIHDLILGGPEALVRDYAERIDYPLLDRDDDKHTPLNYGHLLQMTKYRRITDEEMESDSILKRDYIDFIKNRFCDIAEEKKVPRHLLEALEAKFDDLNFSEFPERTGYPCFEEDHPLLILAGLPFRIYLTTSHHNFIERALRAATKEPRTEFCRWNQESKRVPSVFDTNSILNPEEKYQPVNDMEPLVYHLYGYDDYPESLVLTEDDYLRFLIAISRNKGLDSDPIHKKIREVISYSALILLGYELNSWDFRVLFWGLIEPRSIQSNPKHKEEVSVSIQAKRTKTEQDYFEKYLKQAANCKIYWGEIEEYTRDLAVSLGLMEPDDGG